MSGIQTSGNSSNVIGALSSIISTQTSSPPPFTPRSIPNLALWLDGNDPLGTGTPPSPGASISDWVDKSLNGNDFTQGTTLDQPIFQSNYFGSLGSLFFNGTTSYLEAPYSPLLNGHDTAVFIVLACDSATAGFAMPLVTRQVNIPGNVFGYNFLKNSVSDPNANAWVLELGSNSGGFNSILDGNMVVLANTLLSFSASGGAGGNADFLVNGSLIGTMPYYSEIDGGVTSVARVGCIAPSPPTFFWPGFISEVVVYNATLTSGQYAQVQNYLTTRWGI